MVTIEWNEANGHVQISSWDRLLSRIREIESGTSPDRGIGFDLRKDSGEAMLVIVAGDLWWFTWFPADYESHGTGSFHSTSLDDDLAADSPLKPEDLVSYFYFGHHGEVIRRDGADDSAAIVTLGLFFSTPGIPTTLRWLPD
jgi:hypothetical protein